MSEIEAVGAIVDSGPMDWQVIQQDGRGTGSMDLAGRWAGEAPGQVEVRLVQEASGAPVAAALDWSAATTRPDGTWEARIRDIPAGGLYRLETRFHSAANPAGEWSTRGDLRHHLGVGELWLIAGQSNSAGYGRGIVEDPPELGLHALRHSERWDLAAHPLNDSTGTRHPVNREGANPGHSPFLQFARTLKRALGCPIGLIPTALGGSALAPWNPAEGEAPLYRNMLHCARLAGGRVAGVLWYQGESDTSPALGQTYGERFAQAVRAWREALAAPELAVLTVQLNRVLGPSTPDSDRGWSLVREAQRRAARELPGVAVVPALDLPLSDGIHTSPAGNLILGERLARAALGLVYGRPVDYRAPDIRRAARSADGTCVELEFDHVRSRLEPLDLVSQCFAVEANGEAVTIRATRFPGGNRVRLHLEKPLAGAAVVHGAGGAAPPPVPLDVERQMPILAFCDVPVE